MCLATLRTRGAWLHYVPGVFGFLRAQRRRLSLAYSEELVRGYCDATLGCARDVASLLQLTDGSWSFAR